MSECLVVRMINHACRLSIILHAVSFCCELGIISLSTAAFVVTAGQEQGGEGNSKGGRSRREEVLYLVFSVMVTVTVFICNMCGAREMLVVAQQKTAGAMSTVKVATAEVTRFFQQGSGNGSRTACKQRSTGGSAPPQCGSPDADLAVLALPGWGAQHGMHTGGVWPEPTEEKGG